MQELIEQTAQVIANHVHPAKSKKDRARQAAIAADIAKPLRELCDAVIAEARGEPAPVTVTPDPDNTTEEASS